MKSRKKLTKAQYGKALPIEPVPEYTSDRTVYSGPLEQQDAEQLDSAFPAGPGKGIDSFYPGNIQLRKNNERYMRESDFFNEGKYEQKKGGSVVKGSQLRRQASSKGLRTSKKHK